MKVILITFALFYFANLSFAQELKMIKVPDAIRTESTVVIDGVTTHTYTSGKTIPINGTPFLNKNFEPGILELHDGKKSEEILLRYNIAQDIFEILQGKDTLTINRPFEIKNIFLNNKTFIYDPKLRENEDRKQNGFFEVLVNGKLTLYKKSKKDLSFDSFAGNYQGGSGTKEYYYVDKISFVGKTSEGPAFLIKSSKSLINNLSDHKSEVKSYIKKQNIKLKKEEDLIKLVEFYNQL